MLFRVLETWNESGSNSGLDNRALGVAKLIKFSLKIGKVHQHRTRIIEKALTTIMARKSTLSFLFNNNILLEAPRYC
jgi:hypothetical protein